MNRTTFVWVNGRAFPDGTGTSTAWLTRRKDGTGQAMRERLAAKRFAAQRRAHERMSARDKSDAYLNRTGVSSFDWMDALARQAQR